MGFSAADIDDLVFAHRIHQWAIRGSALFSNVMRHCVDSEEHFEDMINKLIVRPF